MNASHDSQATESRICLGGNRPVDFRSADRADAYEFVRRTLVRFRYGALDKPSKGLLKEFLGKVTGLSRAQLTRLIGQYRATGRIEDRRRGPTRPFERRYVVADIRLLAEVDGILGGLCGPATRRVLQRQFEVFGDLRFERLAGLSNSHLYRLRQTTTYRRQRTTTTKTRPVQVAIGERRKPHPGGRPGFLRVDSVHQGDLDGEKGICLVNVVDEVSQCEFVGAVEAISEAFLLPVLERLIDAFPFRIMGFHTDNGSEYINHRTARLLDKLHVEEFTKSRPRRSNDNALVESKNGTVVRRHLGHAHIPRRHAARVNDFTHHVLSPFLNYHRPCHFPVETVGDDGRTTKRYPYANVATPTTSSSRSTTPSASSSPASPSPNSTPSPSRSANSTPPPPSTPPVPRCSAPSRATRPKSRDQPRVVALRRRGIDADRVWCLGRDSNSHRVAPTRF